MTVNENITITINTGNDAFHNPGPPSFEVARILRQLADKLENNGVQAGEHKLMDINGQSVGKIEVN